jgi:hypothetical protein
VYTNTICQLEHIDLTTNFDEQILHANIDTTWPTDESSDIDSPRFTVGLSPYDWIDEDCIDNDFDLNIPILSTGILQNDENTISDSPTIVLSDLDDKINELGISTTEFYDRLRPDPVEHTSIRAHFDGGSMASTTDQLQCPWYFCKYKTTEHVRLLQVADNHRHHPIGIGFLCLKTSDKNNCFIRCLFTPTLPATIISPHDAGIQYRCIGYSCESKFDGSHCSLRLQFPPDRNQPDISFDLQLIRGLLFSDHVIVPTAQQHATNVPADLPNYVESPRINNIPRIHQLTREQQRILWHQRLL